MAHAFESLTPDTVLDALDSVGLRGDGRLTALSSYENRVYQVQLEDGSAVVAKFYRPERWSDAQIQEEHDFAAELMAAEIPAIVPVKCWSGLAAFWRASTRWVPKNRLPAARAWMCRALAWSPCNGCWSTTRCRWMCSPHGQGFARMLLIW